MLGVAIVVEVQQAWWEVVLTLLVAAGTIGAAVYAARAASAASAAVQLEQERRQDERTSALIADVYCSQLVRSTPNSKSISGSDTRAYFVIVNNGPHEARGVTLEFDGQPPDQLQEIVNGDLAAGQHLELSYTKVPRAPVAPCYVTWVDGRSGLQRRAVPQAIRPPE